jgi:hypothetical protein
MRLTCHVHDEPAENLMMDGQAVAVMMPIQPPRDR